MTAFTFVTVVFDAELDLLDLQARSLARHADPALIEQILVIDNSRRGMPARRRRALPGRYGVHADRVAVVRPAEIGPVPSTTGWYSQQILKLLVAGMVTSDAYIVLDAKNHLLRPLAEATLVTGDGRLRTYRRSFAGHRLEPDLRRTLAYFGVSDDEVAAFTPTVTPFPLRTDAVRAMVADVEQRAGRPFGAEFLRARLLEFFAYSAWIVRSRPPLEAVYEFDGAVAPTVWPKGATADGVAAALADVETGPSPWFSVHRRALGALDPAALHRLAGVWTAAGLFDGEGEAAAFVSAAQRRVRRGERAQRIADTWPRALRLARRLVERVGRR